MLKVINTFPCNITRNFNNVFCING